MPRRPRRSIYIVFRVTSGETHCACLHGRPLYYTTTLSTFVYLVLGPVPVPVPVELYRACTLCKSAQRMHVRACLSFFFSSSRRTGLLDFLRCPPQPHSLHSGSRLFIPCHDLGFNSDPACFCVHPLRELSNVGVAALASFGGAVLLQQPLRNLHRPKLLPCLLWIFNCWRHAVLSILLFLDPAPALKSSSRRRGIPRRALDRSKELRVPFF